MRTTDSIGKSSVRAIQDCTASCVLALLKLRDFVHNHELPAKRFDNCFINFAHCSTRQLDE